MLKWQVLLTAMALPALAGTSNPEELQKAAAALAAGELVAAEKLYQAAYHEGHRDPAVVVSLARLALWKNNLEQAEQLAMSVDASSPEATTAAAIVKAIATRRSDLAGNNYIGIPTETIVIPFLARDPLPTLVGKINGRDAGFIIDTGADQLVVDTEFARELKIEFGDAQSGAFAGGNTASVAHGMADEVRLGKLKLSHVPVTILPTRRFTGFAHQVDAIIGTRFLGRFLTTIDYPGSRLVLAPREVEPQTDGVKLPLSWIGDHFLYTSGLINGKSLGLWLVDTGLAGGGLMVWDKSVLEAAGIELQSTTTKGQGGGGEVAATDFTAPAFQLGDVAAKDLPGKFIPGSPIGAGPAFKVAGIVSHDFFRQYEVTIDLKRMQLLVGREKSTR